MVRGVNRNIIEVNCTENKYFDKVLLFVDPKCSLPQKTLDKKAEQYVRIIMKSGIVPGIGEHRINKALSLKGMFVLIGALTLTAICAVFAVLLL